MNIIKNEDKRECISRVAVSEECSCCHGRGWEYDRDNDKHQCHYCKGSGQKSKIIRTFIGEYQEVEYMKESL